MKIHNGKVQAFIGQNWGNYVEVAGTTIMNDGLWHHEVVVYNRSNDKMYIYLDGNVEVNGQSISSLSGHGFGL